MDEDDLYGGDLYGGTAGGISGMPAEDGYDEQEAFGLRSPGDGASARAAATPAGRAQLKGSRPEADQQEELRKIQAKYLETLALADRWRSAFKQVASMCGYTLQTGKEPDVPAVLESVQRLKAAEASTQAEVKALRQREAALQISLAERNLEGVELRREVAGAVAGADPAIIQLKQLLLDPAVGREFTRLRGDLEIAQMALKTAQEDLSAVAFTQESKIGRQLMAKCRALQAENEDMGMELAEGKLQALSSQLAAAKGYADAMRGNFMELSDHTAVLDEEVEELQGEVFALRRALREAEAHGGMLPGGMQSSEFGGGGGGQQGGNMDRRGGMDHMGGGGFRGRGRGMGGPPMMMDRKRPMDMREGGPFGGGRGGGPGGPGFRGFRGN
ncbi:MAG: hypothetical protein WDW36_009446 [Sanguina aurantia]